MWTPDLFFFNGKSERRHDVLRDNTLLDISEDGEIVLAEKLSLKLGCDMDLSMFPFDQQVCPIRIETAGHRFYFCFIRINSKNTKENIKWSSIGVMKHLFKRTNS